MYRDRWFAYVPRESNGTTHILAKEGLKRGESMNLGVYVPRFLVEVLDLDCQGAHAAGGEGDGGFWMNSFLSSWCFAIYKGKKIFCRRRKKAGWLPWLKAV
ncbi:hypothetical protein V6Z11_D02G132000 [Gossypium hirsutum]